MTHDESVTERHIPAGLPPFDVGAEEAVIAALLLETAALPEVVAVGLRAPDFFREQNAWCFEAAQAVAARGETVTIPTVAYELDRAGRLEAAGDAAYLVELAGKYFTAVGVEAHARIIVRDSTYRQLIQAASQIAQLGYAGAPELDATLATAARLIEGIAGGARTATVELVADAIAARRAAPEERRVTSGYATVDAITGGMAMGQLTVIGARTDNGKTALCVGMALGQAKAGMAVGYIPIEDTRDEVTAKLTDAVAGFSLDWAEKVDPDHIDERLERWERHADAVGGLPVYVPGDGATPTDIDSLLGLVATMAVRSGCRVITIDHIDALPMTRSRGQSDASVVAEWMRSLKSLAVRLDVHLVVASQVSRAADEDGYLPPRMFRLKESGAKEQAAQTVIMVGLDGDVSEGRRVLHAYVEKVKGYPNGRHIDAGDGPALYLEVQSGAVRERGRRVELAPPAEQAAFIEEPAEVAP